MAKIQNRSYTLLAKATVLVFTYLIISGCATAPTSPETQKAFLINFDLVDKEKILFQSGVIDINCYRCRNGTLILTGEGIYLFAQKK